MNDDERNIAQRHRFGGWPPLDSKEGRRVVDAVIGILIAVVVALTWRVAHGRAQLFFDPASGHNAELRAPSVDASASTSCRPNSPLRVGPCLSDAPLHQYSRRSQ